MFVELYREAMKAIIHKMGYGYDFEIQKLAIPDDHIHMVIKGEPKICPSHVMQVIKSISVREFFRGKTMDTELFRRNIGNANEETIRKYVQNQLIGLDNKENNAKQLGLF